MSGRWSRKPLLMGYDMAQDPMTVVRVSERLWSEEVARANAVEGVPLAEKEPAYPFTRHTFMQPDDLYAPNV